MENSEMYDAVGSGSSTGPPNLAIEEKREQGEEEEEEDEEEEEKEEEGGVSTGP